MVGPRQNKNFVVMIFIRGTLMLNYSLWDIQFAEFLNHLTCPKCKSPYNKVRVAGFEFYRSKKEKNEKHIKNK